MRAMRAASLVLVALALAAPADAGERAVEIGEVSSRVAREGVDYGQMVRGASEEELRGLDLSRVPRGRRVIVSVALMRLDTLDGRQTSSTCLVSATLRDARRGALLAVLEGQAKAVADGGRLAVERRALQGALHGALARIPEALRRE